ncbi:uncharacterized protein LOC118439313 isoform X3 [Folsomia candida]|uniref:uncharacterized protein LOC118439313 isoform X3 n=1 Tax=Folsomia candida TaxID=158441 RepID=UPI001604BF0D|nr:uncharacterized protein LOC118439313 isoform X3 [Folsomia candida]
MKTTEEKLLELGKWAVLSGQLAGYLPLSVNNNIAHGRFLHFRALHISSIYALVMFIIITIWLIVFLYNFPTTLVMQSRALKSQFLGITFCFSSLLSGVTVFLLKSLGIIQIPTFATFWHKTVQAMEKLESIDSRTLVNIESKEFRNILHDTKFRFTGYCALIMIQLAVFDFRETFTTLMTKGSQIPVFNLTALVFTLFQIYLTFTHHGHPILLVFFIKLCKTCITVLAEKLDRLNFRSSSNNKSAMSRRESDKKRMNINQIGQSAFGDLEFSIATTTASAFMLPIQRNLVPQLMEGSQNFSSDGVVNMDKELEQIVQVIYVTECQIRRFNRMVNWRISIEFAYQIFFLVVKLSSWIWILWNGKHGFLVIIEPVIPIFLSISAMWCICSDSEDLCEGVNQLGVLLEKVPLQGVGWEMQQKIQMLITRVSAKSPGISPGSYFTLNKAFLVSLLSVLATYFFILTEFREKNEGWNSIRKLNISCNA